MKRKKALRTSSLTWPKLFHLIFFPGQTLVVVNSSSCFLGKLGGLIPIFNTKRHPGYQLTRKGVRGGKPHGRLSLPLEDTPDRRTIAINYNL